MYSRYELSQMQRAKERNVRKWKKTWMIEKEAGIDTSAYIDYNIGNDYEQHSRHVRQLQGGCGAVQGSIP